MFAATGFSLLTFLALVAGIVIHSLKQFKSAKTNQATVTVRSYFLESWTETVAAALGSLVLWMGLPEIAAMFPDFAASVGLSGSVGIISSVACGFIGNSAADLVGGRFRSLSGGTGP